MNWGSLSQNEKLAVYGSVAAIIGGLFGAALSGLIWLTVLAAIAMLVIVLLPMFSPQTTLPGNRGSLMVAAGAVAAVSAALALILSILPSYFGQSYLGIYFQFAALNAILFIVACIGGLVMGWAGWQAFQREGGRFNVGSGGGTGGTAGGGTGGTTG